MFKINSSVLLVYTSNQVSYHNKTIHTFMLLVMNFNCWNTFSVLTIYILLLWIYLFFNAVSVNNAVRLLIPAFIADHEKCEIQHNRESVSKEIF